MITPKFSMEGQVFRMMGSNAHITVSDLLLLENAEGAVSVKLSEKVSVLSRHCNVHVRGGTPKSNFVKQAVL
jgi:hypothetical protein